MVATSRTSSSPTTSTSRTSASAASSAVGETVPPTGVSATSAVGMLKKTPACCGSTKNSVPPSSRCSTLPTGMTYVVRPLSAFQSKTPSPVRTTSWSLIRVAVLST